MAYFECVFGGAIGASIPLVVTCASSFAELTITCTDGTKTLTKTCPSTSPYEVEFMLPNTGTWTISGTISGTTYTESVLVNNFDVELTTNLHLTVDVYSAANDTISYTGIDNQAHTIVTDSKGHATATITIEPTGNTFTFTSSVAKNPTNLSSYYSKSISLTSSTSSIYLMPVDDRMVYWYGYKGNVETLSTANGWTQGGGASFINPTYNTNYVNMKSTTNSQYVGIGSKNSVNGSVLKLIYQGIVLNSRYGILFSMTSKKTSTQSSEESNCMSSTMALLTRASNTYVGVGTINSREMNVYAMWVE